MLHRFPLSKASAIQGVIRSSGLSTDGNALAWKAAVITNGGTVSNTQLGYVSTLVAALKSAGSWSLMDDAWLLVSENSTQALTSLKQLRLATIGGGAPTFTASAGYALNGATDYINTGFIPSTNGVAMTASSSRLDVYERTNVNANTYTAGISASSNRILRIIPRSGTNSISGANCANGTFTLPAADSRGLTSVSRGGSLVTDEAAYKNGTGMTRTVDSTGVGASLPDVALFIGGYNGGGALTTPRACTVGWVSVGAALSAGQELAHYNAIQAYMTALGANV